MAEARTRPTTASVAKHFASQASAERRGDCEAIARMLERATKATPVRWGDAIVGKRLADVDKKALEALIVAAVKGRKAKAKDATKKASERAKGES
jgi:hypothetical protein